jgi:hypothetical protein
MKQSHVVLLAGVLFTVSSCSTESLKRTGYETLQNVQEQRCQKDLSSECPERESYDAYQRKIEELDTPPQ